MYNLRMFSIRVVALLLSTVFYASVACTSEANILPKPFSHTPTNFRTHLKPHHKTPGHTSYIVIDTAHPSKLLQSSVAIGGALDGLDKGSVNQVYSAQNIRAMKSAGLGSISYRLRTELGGEAWHWNPQGFWSDISHKRGYWTSSASTNSPIMLSNGYRLPRRGSTHDQANNDGYSRIDDGDPATFWKSNPYLDKRIAGENHPQWVMIDLGSRKPVDAIRIQWGSLFARAYRIDYWLPGPDGKWGGIENTLYEDGTWIPFQHGNVRDGRGGDTLIDLSDKAVTCQNIRVWMSRSSADGSITDVSETHGGKKTVVDVRDRVGYSIRELGIGTTGRSGRFLDFMRHSHSAAAQTPIQTSSTDSWHRPEDRDPDVEQPGFDRLFASGLTRNLPVLFPLGIVYDTPENAAAEVRWLLAKKTPILGVELGEEPDGQYMTPEDYGALYLQFAHAVHRINPNLQVGGPSYQTVSKENPCWPDASGDRSFTHRFVKYLRRHGATADLQFFSFESYMFDDVCGNPLRHLKSIPMILDEARARWLSEGVPADIPWYITELGYAPYGGEPEVDLSGAIADAEIIAKFLTQGGSAAYFYGYEPNILMNERPQCQTWGNLALLQSNDDYRILRPFAAFYAMQMLTNHWTGHGAFNVYPAKILDERHRALGRVTVYACSHGDGHVSLLLLNKDDCHPIRVQLPSINGGAKRQIQVITYGQRQYHWHPRGEHGYADPNLPPATSSQSSRQIMIQPSSITVIEL